MIALIERVREIRSAETPEELLRLFYPLMSTVVRMASENGTHKAMAIRQALGLKSGDERVIASHHPNGFDEDTQKKNFTHLDNPDLYIAVAKAFLHFGGAELSKQRAVAIDDYIKRFEMTAAGADTSQEWFAPFFISLANDIMQQVGDTQLFKPNIKEAPSALEQRRVVYKGLQQIIGKGSEYADETELVDITLRGTFALHAPLPNIGLTLTEQQRYSLRVLSDEDLKAIVFGIENESVPITDQRVITKFKLGYRLGSLSDWDPKEGLNLKILTKVNGGLKVDHPVFQWAAGEAIDGVTKQTYQSYQEKLTYGREIAAGVPHHLVLLFFALFNQIIYGEQPAHPKINSDKFYLLSNLSSDELDQVRQVLEVENEQEFGRWFAVQTLTEVAAAENMQELAYSAAILYLDALRHRQQEKAA